MAITVELSVSYNLEFRSTKDDAWYTSGVVLDNEKQLRVKFEEFSETCYDEVFSVADFSTDDKIGEFLLRFRPLSVPMEDNECSRVIEGMLVCATYKRDGSVRFFDAIIETVHYKEHTPEKCLCTFLLFWQYGPDEGNITTTSVDNICLLTPGTVDPKVAEFAKLTKEKLRGASSQSGFSRKTSSNQTLDKLQGSGSAGRTSYVEFCEGRGIFYPQLSDQDMDMGGIKGTSLYHYIVLENLEKDLTASMITEFIHEQTSITVQAYVFSSLTVETYARGRIVSDSRSKIKRIYDFIKNPNHLIVSSTGRPWVIAEDAIRTENFKENDIRSGLMVVRVGTEEYVTRKEVKDMFMEFRNHINGVCGRLHVEEKNRNLHLPDAT